MVGAWLEWLAPTIKTLSTTGFQPSWGKFQPFLQLLKPCPGLDSNQINHLSLSARYARDPHTTLVNQEAKPCGAP